MVVSLFVNSWDARRNWWVVILGRVWVAHRVSVLWRALSCNMRALHSYTHTHIYIYVTRFFLKNFNFGEVLPLLGHVCYCIQLL